MAHKYVVLANDGTEKVGGGLRVSEALREAAIGVDYEDGEEVYVYQLVKKFKAFPPKTTTFEEVAL